MTTPTLPPRVASYTRRELERLGALVARFHVRPGMQQTVAEHSYGMLLLALRLWPGCRREFLVAIIEHDLTEVVTGDTPSPIKRHVAEFGAAYKAACAAADAHYGLCGHAELTAEEQYRLRLLDLLDALLWCVDCRRTGNLHSERVFKELYAALADMATPGPLPPEVAAEITEAALTMTRLGYVTWTR